MSLLPPAPVRVRLRTRGRLMLTCLALLVATTVLPVPGAIASDVRGVGQSSADGHGGTSEVDAVAVPRLLIPP